MKKQYYFVCFLLLSTIIFSINLTLINTLAEEDNDGINDDFEEINKRVIEVGIHENEIGIESIRKSGTDKDLIRALIFFDEDGLYIGLSYKSEYDSEWKLEFGVLFRAIIEFNDTNKNGMYNPEIDHKIKNVPLNDFKAVVYETSNISSDTSIHSFEIQTSDEIFIAHIYFVEEFVFIEQSLINPTQAKIEIEISNFEFASENSLLALYTRLECEDDYKIQETTDDEKNGYAEKESGVTTTVNGYTGYFTWKDDVIIDEDIENIFINEIVENEHEEYGKGIFLNYPNGEYITHDFKIGIENLLITLKKPDSLVPLIVLASVIGAVVASSAYAVRYFVKHRGVAKKLGRDRDAYFNEIFENGLDEEPFDGKSALQILVGNNSIEKLSLMNDINITVISEEFFEKLNQFDWESFDKSEFIMEMLALSPKERQSILDEMIKKSALSFE
ncbi:MAG: hypothetical protein ACFFCE_14285 [Promethearchaeota archaeon]